MAGPGQSAQKIAESDGIRLPEMQNIPIILEFYPTPKPETIPCLREPHSKKLPKSFLMRSL